MTNDDFVELANPFNVVGEDGGILPDHGQIPGDTNTPPQQAMPGYVPGVHAGYAPGYMPNPMAPYNPYAHGPYNPYAGRFLKML